MNRRLFLAALFGSITAAVAGRDAVVSCALAESEQPLATALRGAEFARAALVAGFGASTVTDARIGCQDRHSDIGATAVADAAPGDGRSEPHRARVLPGRGHVRHACRMGLEGIVSKRRDRPYVAGPSGNWVKMKCLHREAFVIRRLHPVRRRARRSQSLSGNIMWDCRAFAA